MREFTKSMFSYSLAVSLFALKQLQNIATPQADDSRKSDATRAFENLAAVTTDQFGETLTSVFRMFDNVQRGLVGLAFSFLNVDSNTNPSDSTETTASGRAVRWNSMPIEPDVQPAETAPGADDGALRRVIAIRKS